MQTFGYDSCNFKVLQDAGNLETISKINQIENSFLSNQQLIVKKSQELLDKDKEIFELKNQLQKKREKQFKINEKEEYLIDIENQLKESYVNIDIDFDKEFEEKYINTLNSYKSLLTSEITWDITSSIQQDMKATRSAASSVITRKPVKFKFDNIDINFVCFVC